MLFQPAGGGTFFRACEADSWRGLVAAILDDPDYETADAETRLVNRLRLADDVVLLAEMEGRQVQVADRDAPDTVNVQSDEPFIQSLERLRLAAARAGRFELSRRERSTEVDAVRAADAAGITAGPSSGAALGGIPANRAAVRRKPTT